MYIVLASLSTDPLPDLHFCTHFFSIHNIEKGLGTTLAWHDVLLYCVNHWCYCPDIFAGLSGLRELSLDNTVITDQGIKYIAGTGMLYTTTCTSTMYMYMYMYNVHVRETYTCTVCICLNSAISLIQGWLTLHVISAWPIQFAFDVPVSIDQSFFSLLFSLLRSGGTGCP